MRICWIHSQPQLACEDCLVLVYRRRLWILDRLIAQLRAEGLRMREIDKRRAEAE
jgi:hypothetical protein